MTADDVLTRAAPPPDLVVSYGPGDNHVADVRLPRSTAAGPAGQPSQSAGPRPAPLVLLLHGGFWRAAYDRMHTGPLAVALAAAGFAVCAPEYRRTGQRGGGWPGTFDDIAAAVDALPALVRDAAGAGVVSDAPVILAGHSAGGHLALWAAARHMIAPGAAWHAPRPRVAGVVALAAVSDLATCHALRLGRDAVVALLGGGPDKYPERYRSTDPMDLLPLGCPVRLVHGAGDDVVPCSLSAGFLARSRAAGDDVSLAELPGAGHFDVIDPLSAAWPRVVDAFASLVAA